MASKVNLDVYRTILYFADSEEEFKKIQKLHKFPYEYWIKPGSGGTTQVWEQMGWQLFVISIPKKTSKSYLPEVIAHETAHVVTHIWDYLGEHKVGQEANAYLTGHIVAEATKYFTRK